MGRYHVHTHHNHVSFVTGRNCGSATLRWGPGDGSWVSCERSPILVSRSEGSNRLTAFQSDFVHHLCKRARTSVVRGTAYSQAPLADDDTSTAVADPAIIGTKAPLRWIMSSAWIVCNGAVLSGHGDVQGAQTADRENSSSQPHLKPLVSCRILQ